MYCVKIVGLQPVQEDLVKYRNVDISKFFGSPILPQEWYDWGLIGEKEAFLCMLKMPEVGPYDIRYVLPSAGYLYFFLDMRDPEDIQPIVRYWPGEPECLVDDFNDWIDDGCDWKSCYAVEFASDDGREEGMKLLGDPAELPKNGLPEGQVLLFQFDTRGTAINVLQELDGVLRFYVDWQALDRRDFDNVILQIEQVEPTKEEDVKKVLQKRAQVSFMGPAAAE